MEGLGKEPEFAYSASSETRLTIEPHDYQLHHRLHGAMQAHARETHPEEACGAVFGTGDAQVYHPVLEVAGRSRAGFRIEASVLHRLEEAYGALSAVVISHPWDEHGDVDPLLFTPSASQMRAQMSLEVPFGVVVCSRSQAFAPFWFGDQCPRLPMHNRPFRHGVTDCYSLGRDWYRLNRNILLPDFPREWDWWIAGLDLYRAGFEQMGFREIDPADARPGDALLYRIRSDVPNHAAVLLENGWMLHHPGSQKPYDVQRISYRESVKRWERFFMHCLRREG